MSILHQVMISGTHCSADDLPENFRYSAAVLLLQDVRDNKTEAANAAPQALRLCQMVGPAALNVIVQLCSNCKTSSKLLARLTASTATAEHKHIFMVHVVLLWQINVPAHIMSILTFIISCFNLSAEQPVKRIKFSPAALLLCGFSKYVWTLLFNNTATCFDDRNKSNHRLEFDSRLICSLLVCSSLIIAHPLLLRFTACKCLLQ